MTPLRPHQQDMLAAMAYYKSSAPLVVVRLHYVHYRNLVVGPSFQLFNEFDKHSDIQYDTRRALLRRLPAPCSSR